MGAWGVGAWGVDVRGVGGAEAHITKSSMYMQHLRLGGAAHPPHTESTSYPSLLAPPFLLVISLFAPGLRAASNCFAFFCTCLIASSCSSRF